MTEPLDIVVSIDALRAKVASWRKLSLSIGLVPTMGYLHEGHISLVNRSLAENDRTCVTIFINPKQFGPGEDFASYPRDQKADERALEKCQADLLFAPGNQEMYPEGHVTSVLVSGVGDLLEGEFRPGFFQGIVTVVTKLIFQVLPDRVYFGEKDYQQLCVINTLRKDLNIPVEIVGCPTIREKDGLALSSRNSYLTEEQRTLAPSLHRTLIQTAEYFHISRNISEAISNGSKSLLKYGFSKVDYIAICNPNSLSPANKNSKKVRVLGAAWLGGTRLIDNVEL